MIVPSRDLAADLINRQLDKWKMNPDIMRLEHRIVMERLMRQIELKRQACRQVAFHLHLLPDGRRHEANLVHQSLAQVDGSNSIQAHRACLGLMIHPALDLPRSPRVAGNLASKN